jgi:hypothetical protein
MKTAKIVNRNVLSHPRSGTWSSPNSMPHASSERAKNGLARSQKVYLSNSQVFWVDIFLGICKTGLVFFQEKRTNLIAGRR